MSVCVSRHLSAVLVVFASSLAAAEPQVLSPNATAELQQLREARWPEEKAWAWYADVGPIVGCNYLPRTAVNMTEMW